MKAIRYKWDGFNDEKIVTIHVDEEVLRMIIEKYKERIKTCAMCEAFDDTEKLIKEMRSLQGALYSDLEEEDE